MSFAAGTLVMIKKFKDICSNGECFAAGTLVHTKEGLKPIQEIKVGDYVLSRPENGEGELSYKRVTDTYQSTEPQELWMLEAWSARFDETLVDVNRDPVTNEVGPWKAYWLCTGGHQFYRIGTCQPYNRGLISKEELKKRKQLNTDTEFYAFTPEWVSMSELLQGDIILDKDKNPIWIRAARPLINGGPRIGFAVDDLVVDFRNPLNPEIMNVYVESDEELERRNLEFKSIYEYPYKRFTPEAQAHFLNLRDALNENQAYLDCPENWQYEPINRQWPATPKMCAQMYQRAKPLIRKETVYNLTVEDNHTYVVEHNGITLWCAVISST